MWSTSRRAVVVLDRDVIEKMRGSPPCQPLGDVVTREVRRGDIVGREHQAPEVAAEVRTHEPLAVLRPEEDEDRLAYLLRLACLG